MSACCRWLSDVTFRMLDLRSRRRVVTAWMGDCLRTGKPYRYITNTKVNSAFSSSGIGKSSTGLHGWSYGGACSPVSGGS